MSLKLFKFLQGYIIIKVSGFSVERFINLAMHRNIYLSDIKYEESYVLMKVSIKGFKLLKPIAKKTKCKIKIVKKCGIPFFMFRYRKRKFLLAGFIFFIMSIYILSSRIWLIDIEGLDRIYQNDLVNFVDNNGLFLSAKKSKIDLEKIEEEILNNFDEVAWVNINIKGTKAVIKIKETIEKKEIVEKQEISNIVAKKDGIIEQIVVSSGTAKVKPYDVVKKGDILVEGILEVKEDEFGVLKKYVASNANVLAKTYYKFNFDIPYSYEEKIYTGKQEKNFRFNIFNKTIELFNPKVKFENYNRTSEYKQLNLGESYPLPIIIIKDTYNEIIPVTETRNLEVAKELGLKIVDKKILSEIAFDVNIVDKNIKISENVDSIEFYVEILTVENIVEWEDINEEEYINNDKLEEVN